LSLTAGKPARYTQAMAPQPSFRPMPLVRIPEPFDHPDWLFEVKHDGFRALAHVEGHQCRLVSRNGHTFRQWPHLCEELAHAVKAHDAVLDGEIVCLDRRGRSDFKSLLYRRVWPYFYAFDLLAVDGDDLRAWPLIERKRRLRTLIPPVPTRLLYVESVEGRGRDFFEVACAYDLEGIVAKLADGRYHADGTSTSWVKIKNPHYTQATGRHELFERRTATGARARNRRPVLVA
jgi:bifunctional non-homologous end joining protein LigD